MYSDYDPQPWMKKILAAAGLYNLAWGAIAIFAPATMLGWFGVDSTTISNSFWQCIGMIVGVYGVGYLLASRHPFVHWPITLVGLMGKVFGPLGFLAAIQSETLPTSFGWTILTNDLIWWAPFAVILWGALRYHQTVGSVYGASEADDPMNELRTNTGQRIDYLADKQPQLFVFLRHAGCTFCREALSDLSKQREQIEAAGCGIVLVHNDQHDIPEFFESYSMQDLPRIADPECRLYRQFGLDLGGFTQLFGLSVILRGVKAALLDGHGVGTSRGNTFQMPGIFLYHCGQILDGFQHDQASDRPNYVDFVSRNVMPPQVAAAV